MRKSALFAFALTLIMGASVNAVPTLQLFVAGGTYDNSTETWVANSNSFDLYVIGANEVLHNVMVNMALNIPEATNPNGSANIDVNGHAYNSWTYGTPDLLPPHDIFPAWYTEFNSGNYGYVGRVGDTNDELHPYDPSQGYLSHGGAWGQYRRFHITLTGIDYTHFDGFLYTQDHRCHTRIQFAPFSHDAESGGSAVPEPGTLALFGLGSLGMGLVRKFRKQA